MHRLVKLFLSLFIIFFYFTTTTNAVPMDYLEKNISLTPTKTVTTSSAAGSTPFQLEELAVFQFSNQDGSDCWGWKAPDGQQYAIMGISSGVVFVNATTLQIVDTVLGSGCVWQDIKTYQNYAYAVNECGGGLRVIDMQYLPDSVHLVGIFPTSDGGAMSSHNVFIDTTRGFLYTEGSPGNTAIQIFDLTNPEVPAYVNSFGISNNDVHDFYVINDTAYVAGGSFPSFEIYDLTDKLNPNRLLRVMIPNAGYIHNIWPSDDRRFVITTEETGGKTVKIWYIEDYNDVRLTGEYLAPNGLAHNAFVVGNYIYLSHYSSGVRVIDMSNPYCPTEAAVADLPSDNCWGVYPYTGDSLVYSSHLDGRLFIYRFIPDPAYVFSGPDVDNDGIDDNCDNCLNVNNPSQLDTDIDGIGDICDSCPNDPYNDADNDGICGDIDNCANYNPDQADSDGDGIADACDACPNDAGNDIDGDFICGDIDNCPTISNELQTDADNDGVGDDCDNCPNDQINDPDADGLCAVNDNCDLVYNPNQLDSDSDGIGDACDNCPTTFNPSQDDINSDGIGDACCCIGIRGNINGDKSEQIDISDLVYVVQYSFGTPSGPTPPCPNETDVDNSGGLDISDIVYLVSFMFGSPSGPAPVNCL